MLSIPLFSTAEGSPIVPGSGKRLGFERISALLKLAQVAPASRLELRPAPEMVPSGVGELDALTGGWPRGCLSEICGAAASSGRTSVLLAALVAATQRQEACALVDANDMFDPASAATAGVNFEKLLWVRCGSCPKETLIKPGRSRSRFLDSAESSVNGRFCCARNDKAGVNQSFPKNSPRRHPSTALRAGSDTEEKGITDGPQVAPAVEQALRITDLLLQNGGFGLVVIDLGSVPFRTARRISLAFWFRFQRAVEHTPTVLLVVTPAPCAQTCATVLLRVKKLSAFSSQLSADLGAMSQLGGGEKSGASYSSSREAAAHESPARHRGPQSARFWRSGVGQCQEAEVEQNESRPSLPRANVVSRGEGYKGCNTAYSASGLPGHTQLLDGLSVEGEVLRSRLGKPVRSVTTAFETKALCAG